jgi:hypothetical protein
MKRVLIITYYWPPFGGTGVYRISKFTKYLSQLGWEPIILTPKKAIVPIIDENLLKEVPDNVKVYYTGIYEPSIQNKDAKTTNGINILNKRKTLKNKIIRWIRLNIFVPDAKIGWYPYAVSVGKKVIRKEKPDIIFSTSPPPTTSLISKKLAKWSKIPWVADFRDPWTKIYYFDNIKRTLIADKINCLFERITHKEASAITVVNDGFFPHLEEFHAKTIKIINGFDRDDIASLKPIKKKNEKFTVCYFGGYKSNQESDGFYNAIKEIAENTAIKNKICFNFYGYTETHIQEKFEPFRGLIEFHTYIQRKKALQFMKNSDLVLLFIGKQKNNQNIISTKIFEYMMLEKKILAIGPLEGSANQLIEQTQLGKMFAHNDKDGIIDFLLTSYIDWSNDIKNNPINKEAIDNYDFKELTKKLASVFELTINNGKF